MKDTRYLEGKKAILVLEPKNIVATAAATNYVDLNLAHGVDFLVMFGAVTSDTSDTATVTLLANAVSDTTSSDDSEISLAFNYRLSSALGTDSVGAITAATTDGVAVIATDDNKVLYIKCDPSAVANAGAYRFVRLLITPNAEMGACNVSALALVEPRYAGNAMPSSS